MFQKASEERKKIFIDSKSNCKFLFHLSVGFSVQVRWGEKKNISVKKDWT